MQARGYYDQYGYNGDFPFNYADPLPGPVMMNFEHDQAQWIGCEASVSKTFWERQHLTLGGEFRDDLQLKLSNADAAPPLTYVNSQRTANSFGLYLQDELKIVTNLTLNAGVRYDHFSTFGDTVNPRAALIYAPWRDGTFKFIYGQAFRAPNEYETSYIQPAFKTNPNLKPETIRSYELVYEQGLPGHLRFSGSVFLEQIKGLIGQTVDPADGLNYFANLDQVESRGFETELEGRWAGGLRTRLSYTYAEARDTLTGKTLDNSPRPSRQGQSGRAAVAGKSLCRH